MAGSAAELMSMLGWQPENVVVSPRRRNLFPELSGKEKLIYDHLRFTQEPAPIDEIRERTGISIHELLATLGEMEFDGMVERLQGNRFALINY